MSLNDFNFPLSITTGFQDPINDLFVPILREAKTYDIAVGYFTSGWMKDTAEGLAHFALSGGKSRWIVSPELNEQDARSLIEGVTSDTNIESLSERKIIEIIKSLQKDTREELCALISVGVLNFRIALTRELGDGIFHAKIGVAADDQGNEVGFSGSFNMTAMAKSNWERIDVFRSWEEAEDKRIVDLKNRFDQLWKNKDPRYRVTHPTKELLSLIKQEAGNRIEDFKEVRDTADEGLGIELRPYQKEAIENWGKNNGRGTFVMATGSGKTVTALATIKRLISIIVEKSARPLVVVIVLPLKHLLDQWYQEANAFGFDTVKCYESSESWRKKLAERLGVLKVLNKGSLIALVTNRTFAMGYFQEFLARIDVSFMLVADEAHNLGSSSYLDALPANANYRLALSATPHRYNDRKGTEALFDYFGAPVIDFTLEDAIKSGYLCAYEYHPHLCSMSDIEYEVYLSISDLIAVEKRKITSENEKTKEHLRLLGKRADLISGVDSKLEILGQLLSQQHEDGGVSHTLVYCGSRRGEDSERHIERTVKLIGSLGVKTRKFTADESLEERREILDLFDTGELETIAAIKCLDEGIDVPATRIAYILASTANPREYIQRRGRVLRNSKGKSKATIHDFLVAPPPNRLRESDLVERELERAAEFSEIALNRGECQVILSNLAEQNGLEGWL